MKTYFGQQPVALMQLITRIKLAAPFGFDAEVFTRFDSVYRDRCERGLE